MSSDLLPRNPKISDDAVKSVGAQMESIADLLETAARKYLLLKGQLRSVQGFDQAVADSDLVDAAGLEKRVAAALDKLGLRVI